MLLYAIKLCKKKSVHESRYHCTYLYFPHFCTKNTTFTTERREFRERLFSFVLIKAKEQERMGKILFFFFLLPKCLQSVKKGHICFWMVSIPQILNWAWETIDIFLNWYPPHQSGQTPEALASVLPSANAKCSRGYCSFATSPPHHVFSWSRPFTSPDALGLCEPCGWRIPGKINEE